MKRNNKNERLLSPMNVPGEREDNLKKLKSQNERLLKKRVLCDVMKEKEDCSVHQIHQMREI